jgi:peptidoglycan L-alanyl-D-glutamate endopeptidase CwlK
MIPLSTARQITEAKVRELRPGFQTRVRAWLAACEDAGLVIYIYEGFRTCQRQNELYAMGRTKKGTIVTNAQAGQSMHQYKLAIDFVPLIPAKAAGMWDAAWGKPDEARLYKQAQKLAAKFQLRPLSWETPHLEDATFADWKAARSAFGDPCRP